MPSGSGQGEDSDCSTCAVQDLIITLGLDLKLDRKLNSGSFGTVYRGSMAGRQVAVKVEPVEEDSENETLKTEYRMYRWLHNDRYQKYIGIPRVLFYFSGLEQAYRILVLPCMGLNLKQLMNRQPNRRFSIQTTALIALQGLQHLQYLSSKGIVHRDIKPANLIIGSNRGFGQSCIYLVDFGLSKFFISQRTGKHISNRKCDGVTGTLRYMGIHAHEANEASRRDDLQAFAYMLIYFLKGRLPWQDIETSAPGEDNWSRVHQMKRTISTRDLCADLPEVFSKLLDYSNDLVFDEDPDYELLQRMFFDFLVANFRHVKYEFDWTTRPAATGSSAATTTTHISSSTAPADHDHHHRHHHGEAGSADEPRRRTDSHDSMTASDARHVSKCPTR